MNQQHSTAQGILKDQINQNFDIRRFLASVVGYWYLILLCLIECLCLV
jgi:hypothetical protein